VRLPDTNVLLAAVNEDAPGHPVARDWMNESLSDAEPTGFAWLALVGFVRIATKASIFASPLSAADALDVVEEWLARPNATVLHPGERHVAILRALLRPAATAGNLTSDAHLAAIAIEHRAKIATFDSDFHRFAELRLEYLRPSS
jgi:toxin-antitoxin system PIN domain toxin